MSLAGVNRYVMALTSPTLCQQWIGKPGYNLTTDLADEAIKYIGDLNASAPEKPFFVYYVRAAPIRHTSRRKSGYYAAYESGPHRRAAIRIR